jgi:hypothetical protein
MRVVGHFTAIDARNFACGIEGTEALINGAKMSEDAVHVRSRTCAVANRDRHRHAHDCLCLAQHDVRGGIWLRKIMKTDDHVRYR